MTRDNQSEEEEIDLIKLAGALWHKVWLIILLAFIGGGVMFFIGYRSMVVEYESSTLLYVNNNSVSLGSTRVSISNGDITAANNLIDTFSQILLSRTVLEEIIAESELPFTYEELQEMISAEPVGDTAVFKITVRYTDPVMAAHIANSILLVLPDKIATIVEGSSVQIIDYAIPSEEGLVDNPLKPAAIGALVGAVIACAFIVLTFLLDTTIREEDYLLDTYRDIPVLATIPNLYDTGKGGYSYGYAESEARDPMEE